MTKEKSIIKLNLFVNINEQAFRCFSLQISVSLLMPLYIKNDTLYYHCYNCNPRLAVSPKCNCVYLNFEKLGTPFSSPACSLISSTKFSLDNFTYKTYAYHLSVKDNLCNSVECNPLIPRCCFVLMLLFSER